MRVGAVSVLAGSLVAGALAIGAEARLAQPASCLHGPGETAQEASRRTSALGFVRAINSAEAQARAATGRYQPVTTLTLPSTPEGFLLQFGESTEGYVLAFKDTTDPCRFAFVTDQEGVIYTARPIQ